jgi:hypothetical protein
MPNGDVRWIGAFSTSIEFPETFNAKMMGFMVTREASISVVGLIYTVNCSCCCVVSRTNDERTYLEGPPGPSVIVRQ